MKNKISWLLTLLLTLITLSTSAYDIAVANTDGVTIYYVWTNNQTELAVSYRGGATRSYLNGYTGSVVIPEKVTYNGMEYPVTSIGKSAFSGCSGLTSVDIPNSVTSIGDDAFAYCSGLTSVDIPNSVTSIGSEAFSGCSGLTSVDIPNSVTSIGDDAFYRCSGLTSVDIPNSVTSIGVFAFSGCSGLTSVIIPNSVTSIESSAFYECYNIKSLTIGTGVLSIGSNAFSTPVKTIWLTNTPPSGYTCASGRVNYVPNEQYSSMSNKTVYPFLSSMFEVDGVKYVPVSPSERTCEAIDCNYDESAENIHIEESVSYKGIQMTVKKIHNYAFYKNNYIKNVNVTFKGDIGDNAFCNCDSLTTATIGNNGNIGDNAFYDCDALTTANIGNEGIIGVSAFSACNALTTATLGKTFTRINNYVFSGCSSLQGIVIPDSVTSVGEYAFSGCRSMTLAKIGKSVKTLGQNTFSGCSSLPEIILPQALTTVNNYVFSGCSNLKTVIVDDRTTVLNLGSNGSNPLFVDCPLDSVYIGGNISYSTSSRYGYSPFYRNTSLRSVMITDEETEISDNEFYGCTNLQNVYIGDGVTTIGKWAFSGCSSLDHFTFGSQVAAIGQEAFSDCTALKHIKSHAATPPTCGTEALNDINKWECTLVVPLHQMAAYQAADQWKEFFFVQEEDETSLWFKLTYVIDGTTYKVYSVRYSDAITAEPAPEKEGYTFSGWSDIPATMPSRDVVVRGAFSLNATGGENTNICNVGSETQHSAPVYDLQGRRVVNSQRGLYIQNGKKYVVR